MITALGNITKHWRLARDAWRYRRVYATRAEAWKAYELARQAKFPRAGAAAGERCTVSLRGLPQEIHLRRGTTDFLVIREIFEREIYRGVRDCGLAADARILDLGGNIGLGSLYFAIHLPQSRIVVVEPDADNRCLLEVNCGHLIRTGRLQMVAGFVAAADGSAAIDRSGGNWGFRKLDLPIDGSEAIPCVSVPTLMQRYTLPRIDLLKCDIEGSEREVFAGCGPWVHRVDHLMVETHGSYRLSHLYEDLGRAGWRFNVREERQRSETGQCLLKRTEA